MTRRLYDPAIEKVAVTFPHLDMSDAIGARNMLDSMVAAMAAEGVERASDDRIKESERMIPGPDGAPDILIRIYTPENRKQPGPGFVNLHGGGFILGGLEIEHPRCLMLAAKGDAVVVSVDYRLAPEHPFPAAAEDCYTALCWVVEHAAELHIDPARIVTGGGSAGGNLTAGVALMARDRGGPQVALQMLFYPMLDDRCETTSMQDGADLYICDSRDVSDMWNQYLGRSRQQVSPYAAPARAQDLSGLPPTYMVTCEHDPLRDEGILYAMRLMAHGVPVELHNYPGTVHGFDLLIPSPVATRALHESIAAFKQAAVG